MCQITSQCWKRRTNQHQWKTCRPIAPIWRISSKIYSAKMRLQLQMQRLVKRSQAINQQHSQVFIKKKISNRLIDCLINQNKKGIQVRRISSRKIKNWIFVIIALSTRFQSNMAISNYHKQAAFIQHFLNCFMKTDFLK